MRPIELKRLQNDYMDFSKGWHGDSRFLVLSEDILNITDQPDGPYQMKDPENGDLFKGHIKNGRLNGKFKCTFFDCHFIYEDPQKKATIQGHITDGVLDGPWECQYVDGLTIKGNYKKGELIGPYEVYRGNKVLLKCNIRGIKKDRHWNGRDYVNDYIPEFTGEFQSESCHCFYDDDGKLDGPFETDTIKCSYKHGILHGSYEERDGDGNLKKKCSYNNGELDGAYEERNAIIDNRTTNRTIKCTYTNGRKVGDYAEYTKDGKPVIKCHYNKEGQLDGRYQRYTDWGDLRLDLSYKNGQLDGECTEYHFYNNQPYPGEKSVFKNGKQISYIFNFYDLKSDEFKIEELSNLPNGTEFHWDYWHSCPYGIQPELITSCRNLKVLKLDNSTEDHYGNWRTSNRKIPQEVWDGVAQNTNLEKVELVFMDTDFHALSQLKNLRSLSIVNKGRGGHSGFTVGDEDIAALGTLPKLERLSIDYSYITAEGLKKIKKQFPKLEKLRLVTTVSCSRDDLAEYCGHLDFDVNGFTNEAFAAEIKEMKRRKSLIGPGFEAKFKTALKKGDHKGAAEILALNGLMEEIDTKERGDSNWTTPLLGTSYTVYSGDRDIFDGVKVIDLKNGNYAVATRREGSHFSSGDGGETMYWYYGNLMVVNLKDGVLAQDKIDYTKTAGYGLGVAIGPGAFDGEKGTYYGLDDITVKDGKVSIAGTTLPIDPPKRKDLRARLRAATTKERKSIAEMLAKGTYMRDTQAKGLMALRKERDKEKSSLTTRAYQAKKESTK